MMVKSLLLAILLFASAVFAATNDCGPPQCYSPCTDAKPVVDFVFMLDVSGSMGGPIAGVKSGLTSFINNLGSTITPRYALLLFGASSGNGAATKSLDFTTSASTLISKFSVYIDGGIEPGLETFLRALNSAAANNFNLNYNTGLNTQKVFIMVTNEDSDPAQSSNSNLFYSGGFSQSKSQTDGYCKTSVSNYCGSGSITTLSAGVWNTYQMEITAVANALISQGASTYIFVPGTQSIAQSNSNSECNNKDVIPAQSCNTKYQYCNPDAQSQNADYTNFSPSNTYNTMVSNGQEQSLQGLLIHAGKTARCFDVYATGNSALVQNFFSQIVSDVSACHTTCYDYICITATTCQAPVNMCGCDNVKYSNKTLDPDGNCCLTKDCNGYCNNKYSYDSCGICTLGGATSSLCKTDCNGNKYISAAPTTAYTVQTINVAGYLLMNPTVKTAYINTYKSTAGVQQQFHDTGVFQGLSYCTLDLAAYNSANGVSLSQANAEAAWLASLLTSSPKTAQCAAGSHRHFPALPTDSCGQCIVNADSPPYCVKDCSGVWRTNQTLASFVDHCLACVPAGSDPDAAKDDCGICNGGNNSKNQCGVCGGSKSLDPCGNPVCQNQNCTMDCDGVSRPESTKTLDECGNCVLRSLNPPRSNKCVQDCAGTWYNNTNPAPNKYDDCGNCIPRTLNPPRLSTCVQDCAGTWAGTAYYDQCNQCVTAPSANCKQDCNGTYYLGSNPPSLVDDCGICNPRNAQNTLKDNCGICINQVGYNTATDCTQDCKGVYSLTTSTGRAFNDSCRDCWFANQTALANSKMDNCGVCRSGPNDPLWNSGSGVFDSKGHPCPCGQTPTNCSDGSNTCSDSCPVYCPNTTNTLPDSCGFCPDSPRFGKVDNCGLCCDNVTTLCDIHKDSCGVCFGFDRDRQNPCNICDPTGTLCVPDCAGNYTGHLVVGCDGVCGSHAVCAVCGDGTIQPGEGCDLGTTHGVNNNKPGSGCSADCQVESGGNIGAAIGGAIGGVAAIAALALAAFFAVRYAKKAGLIGNANKQVDFGASNSNPLYKSETSVHQNPLYEN